MLRRTFLLAPGSIWKPEKAGQMIRDHLWLVPEQQTILEGGIAMEMFIGRADNLQQFQAVTDLKRRQVSTLAASRGALVLLFMDLLQDAVSRPRRQCPVSPVVSFRVLEVMAPRTCIGWVPRTGCWVLWTQHKGSTFPVLSWQCHNWRILSRISHRRSG